MQQLLHSSFQLHACTTGNWRSIQLLWPFAATLYLGIISNQAITHPTPRLVITCSPSIFKYC
jgi:hypothetical protein